MATSKTAPKAQEGKTPRATRAKKPTGSTRARKSQKEIQTKAAKTASNKKKFLEALEEAHGIVSVAAVNAGVSSTQVYKWKTEDRDFSLAWAGVKDSALDHVESKLMDLINGITVAAPGEDGDTKIYERPPCKTSIIFYLKTQGKERGYTERQEIAQVNGITVTVQTIGED